MKVATGSTAGRNARIASKVPSRRNEEFDIGKTFLRRNNGTALGSLVPNSQVIVFAPGRKHEGKTSKFPKVPRLRSGRGNWKEVSSTFASRPNLSKPYRPTLEFIHGHLDLPPSHMLLMRRLDAVPERGRAHHGSVRTTDRWS